ncbi:hypothetical protein ND860_17840 [Leptospira levettii]|uniref:hypothetical protein n=1 Tax=Leptospira levettii TaxID=2023178 RepID=UPI00223DBF7C|nr:hypothetical protein [Leptospira levettii]MCW7498403.1 hypothetical protein [Leptospira levettii]
MRPLFLKHIHCLYIQVLLILFLSSCVSKNTNIATENPQSRNIVKSNCPFPIKQGVVYGKGISQFDSTFVMFITKQLLFDLCEGHFFHLLGFVDAETGLFVDAKGYWSKQEVALDLQDPNGYFSLYYFDQKKLDLKKGNQGNLTIRDVFVQAGPVVIDIYVGSKEEVELKFRFDSNPKLERYLINPSFIKIGNNWYLHRMF